jgi:hypothetical protein
MGSETTSAFSIGIYIIESLEEKAAEMLVGPRSFSYIAWAPILQLCILVIEHLGLSSRGFWLI